MHAYIYTHIHTNFCIYLNFKIDLLKVHEYVVIYKNFDTNICLTLTTVC